MLHDFAALIWGMIAGAGLILVIGVACRLLEGWVHR